MTMSTKPANEARAEIALPTDHPMMNAWNAFCETDEFKNALRWARETKYDDGRPIDFIQQEQHTKGALWLAFTKGMEAEQPHPAAPADAGDAIMALSEMRAKGWTVAVHNDYRLDGQPMTFWLFTHEASERFVKGEGPTDWAAVKQALAAARRLLDAPPGATKLDRYEFEYEAMMPRDDGDWVRYSAVVGLVRALEYIAYPDMAEFAHTDACMMATAFRNRARAALAPAEPAQEWPRSGGHAELPINYRGTPAEPERAMSGEMWQCPKCKRWQSHQRGVCLSEFDTGIPCDGKAPAPAASSAAEGSVTTGEGGE
jgi:hypothetical protein